MDDITTIDLKAQLRIIDTDDPEIDNPINQLLDQCLIGAKTYVVGSIGQDQDFYKSDTVQAIYRIAVLALATAYYQNPSALTTGSVTKVNYVLQSIIAQLRGQYEQFIEQKSGVDTDG